MPKPKAKKAAITAILTQFLFERDRILSLQADNEWTAFSSQNRQCHIQFPAQSRFLSISVYFAKIFGSNILDCLHSPPFRLLQSHEFPGLTSGCMPWLVYSIDDIVKLLRGTKKSEFLELIRKIPGYVRDNNGLLIKPNEYDARLLHLMPVTVDVVLKL